MSRQTIADPSEWRQHVGKARVEVERRNGLSFSGPLTALTYDYVRGTVEVDIGEPGERWTASGLIDADGQLHSDDKITVTVEVPDPPATPEPTVPWTLVRFADCEVWAREDVDAQKPWRSWNGSWDWAHLLAEYGEPVDIALPSWADKAFAADRQRTGQAYDAGRAQGRSEVLGLVGALAATLEQDARVEQQTANESRSWTDGIYAAKMAALIRDHAKALRLIEATR